MGKDNESQWLADNFNINIAINSEGLGDIDSNDVEQGWVSELSGYDNLKNLDFRCYLKKGDQYKRLTSLNDIEYRDNEGTIFGLIIKIKIENINDYRDLSLTYKTSDKDFKESFINIGKNGLIHEIKITTLPKNTLSLFFGLQKIEESFKLIRPEILDITKKTFKYTIETINKEPSFTFFDKYFNEIPDIEEKKFEYNERVYIRLNHGEYTKEYKWHDEKGEHTQLIYRNFKDSYLYYTSEEDDNKTQRKLISYKELYFNDISVYENKRYSFYYMDFPEGNVQIYYDYDLNDLNLSLCNESNGGDVYLYDKNLKNRIKDNKFFFNDDLKVVLSCPINHFIEYNGRNDYKLYVLLHNLDKDEYRYLKDGLGPQFIVTDKINLDNKNDYYDLLRYDDELNSPEFFSYEGIKQYLTHQHYNLHFNIFEGKPNSEFASLYQNLEIIQGEGSRKFKIYNGKLSAQGENVYLYKSGEIINIYLPNDDITKYNVTFDNSGESGIDFDDAYYDRNINKLIKSDTFLLKQFGIEKSIKAYLLKIKTISPQSRITFNVTKDHAYSIRLSDKSLSSIKSFNKLFQLKIDDNDVTSIPDGIHKITLYPTSEYQNNGIITSDGKRYFVKKVTMKFSKGEESSDELSDINMTLFERENIEVNDDIEFILDVQHFVFTNVFVSYYDDNRNYLTDVQVNDSNFSNCHLKEVRKSRIITHFDNQSHARYNSTYSTSGNSNIFMGNNINKSDETIMLGIDRTRCIPSQNAQVFNGSNFICNIKLSYNNTIDNDDKYIYLLNKSEIDDISTDLNIKIKTDKGIATIDKNILSSYGGNAYFYSGSNTFNSYDLYGSKDETGFYAYVDPGFGYIFGSLKGVYKDIEGREQEINYQIGESDKFTENTIDIKKLVIRDSNTDLYDIKVTPVLISNILKLKYNSDDTQRFDNRTAIEIYDSSANFIPSTGGNINKADSFNIKINSYFDSSESFIDKDGNSYFLDKVYIHKDGKDNLILYKNEIRDEYVKNKYLKSNLLINSEYIENNNEYNIKYDIKKYIGANFRYNDMLSTTFSQGAVTFDNSYIAFSDAGNKVIKKINGHNTSKFISGDEIRFTIHPENFILNDVKLYFDKGGGYKDIQLDNLNSYTLQIDDNFINSCRNNFYINISNRAFVMKDKNPDSHKNVNIESTAYIAGKYGHPIYEKSDMFVEIKYNSSEPVELDNINFTYYGKDNKEYRFGCKPVVQTSYSPLVFKLDKIGKGHPFNDGYVNITFKKKND